MRAIEHEIPALRRNIKHLCSLVIEDFGDSSKIFLIEIILFIILQRVKFTHFKN